MFPSILIVDDEPSIVQSLKGLLVDEGFDVMTAPNGYEALKIIESESPDLVLLDIWMPGIDGIETLKEIKANNPFIQVIIITGHGNVETAVKATKLGAFDLIEKPLSIDKVIVGINNALNFRRLEEENRYLRKKTLAKNSIDGNSPSVLALKQKVAAVASTDTWVLITGENGTGKELVARTIFQLGSRAEKPFVDVNCAAIPEELIESELFGHEKGAFTGAATKKRGKFEIASGGTILLDEIGDMSLKTQAKILRVLQEQQFQRVGGSRVLKVDVRVIAATNKDLASEIKKGTFREDLYYRLNVVPIEVPSLRERKDDIPLLADHFLDDCAIQNRSRRKHIDPEALELLAAYPWPGNVRELKNLIERLIILVPGERITPDDIPPSYRTDDLSATVIETDCLSIDDFKEAKKAFEEAYLRDKLRENDGNVSQTARRIGVGRSYLHKKLKQFNH
ncbi:MAG: sigma-54 dependent transcriptional regulator [Deltaproteobacteria bacterium]|jgi:two-component system nitrogen regulation response regulator NtrX|nr:sigma-54 dependent transcriptional regulator [Deltaproteobacteria bacterium]